MEENQHIEWKETWKDEFITIPELAEMIGKSVSASFTHSSKELIKNCQNFCIIAPSNLYIT